MVKLQGNFLVTSVEVPPIEELESGNYKYVYHGAKSEFKNIEEYKTKVKAEWETYEGLKVNKIDIVQTPAHPLEPDWIWQDGLTNITKDHTDLEVYFTVSSPFPWTILLIVIGLAIAAIIAYLLRGTFEKLAEAVYIVTAEYPWIWILIAGAILLLAVAPKIKRRER